MEFLLIRLHSVLHISAVNQQPHAFSLRQVTVVCILMGVWGGVDADLTCLLDVLVSMKITFLCILNGGIFTWSQQVESANLTVLELAEDRNSPCISMSSKCILSSPDTETSAN